MNDLLAEKIIRYTEARQLRIRRKLGSGNQGWVYAALHPWAVNEIAVKFHKESDPYFREKHVYERLGLRGVSEMEGFNVPELVQADDTWLVLHLTIVPKPYVLDFAGAYLDERPEFSEEIWEQWLHDKKEMFEERWPVVEKVMFGFRLLGVHLMDIHPRNIAFLEVS